MQMNYTFTKAFKELFFGVGLNGSLCNFISFTAWLRRGLATMEDLRNFNNLSQPRRPKLEEFS